MAIATDCAGVYEYAPWVSVDPVPRLNLGALLLAVERAAPVQAVEALAEELARAIAADEVGFLIAD